jgi:ATP-dependent exoDNAse (exonuclease V) alpha subunit
MFLAKPAEYPFEYLIIDEISMVPNELMSKVLMKLAYAQPEGRKLKVVLLGDPNQLQPIQWGDLFNQLLSGGTVPRTHLVKDHRRANPGGVLFQNTNQFALADELNEIIFEWGDDCQFVQGQLPEMEALLKSLHAEGISHQQITVVSPYKDLDDVNHICQKVFLDPEHAREEPKDVDALVTSIQVGPPKARMLTDAFGRTWYVGARVMMTQKNFYDIDVMNGDEGIIEEVNAQRGYVRVLFNGGQDVNIPTFVPEIVNSYEEQRDSNDTSDPLSTKYLAHSWAVTVHKSQGSEWQVVIFFVRAGRNSSSFFNCNLLYTGISRAKIKLYVVANAKTSFESAIYVNPPKRHDNLARRMRGEEFVNEYRDASLEHTQRLLVGV